MDVKTEGNNEILFVRENNTAGDWGSCLSVSLWESAGRQAGRQTDRQTLKDKGRQTQHTLTDIQTDRQTGRQTDKQTLTDKGRQTHSTH